MHKTTHASQCLSNYLYSVGPAYILEGQAHMYIERATGCCKCCDVVTSATSATSALVMGW